MNHKQLDAEWSKLTLELKQHGLNAALSWKKTIIKIKKDHQRKKEAEKGKQVGYECTCLPEYKESCVVDFLCMYCKEQHRKDYNRSPG